MVQVLTGMHASTGENPVDEIVELQLFGSLELEGGHIGGSFSKFLWSPSNPPRGQKGEVPNETQASVSARGKLAPSFGFKVVGVLFLVSVDPPATSF